jgi:hypothetical protein
VTCPSCGTIDAKSNTGRGMFRCVNAACGLERDIEQVAAWNMLARTGMISPEEPSPRGPTTPFARNKAKRDALAKSLREGLRSAKRPRK